jgi:hypothetical protein
MQQPLPLPPAMSDDEYKAWMSLYWWLTEIAGRAARDLALGRTV